VCQLDILTPEVSMQTLPVVGEVKLDKPVGEVEVVEVCFDASRGVFKADLVGVELEAETYDGIKAEIQSGAVTANRPSFWRPFYGLWIDASEDTLEVAAFFLSPDGKRVMNAELGEHLSVTGDLPAPDSPLGAEIETFRRPFAGRYITEAVFVPATPVVQSAVSKVAKDTRETAEAVAKMKERLRASGLPLLERIQSGNRVVEDEDDAMRLLITADSEPQVFSRALEILRTIVLRAALSEGSESNDLPKGFQMVTPQDVLTIRSLLAQVGIDPIEGLDSDDEESEQARFELAKSSARSWSANTETELESEASQETE
jgi:hypothetical protein